MVLWLWNEHGVHRIEDPSFVPTFFLHAPTSELSSIRQRIEILDGVREVREVSRRISLEDEEPKPVLEIVPRHYRDLRGLAHILDSNGGYVDHRLFNVDLRFSQWYAMEHGIFPMGLVRYANGRWTPEEEHFALDYPIPPLRPAVLDLHVDTPLGIPRFQDRLLGARVGDIEVSGSESEILERLNGAVKELDPDVILTDNGDAFLMPYLATKAAEHKVPLQLGRDPDRFVEKRGKSYFTYGKIVYKPGQYLLKGRLHLDRGHFAYREAAMAGLAELSRMSLLMPQEQARLTPGTAISAMQVNLASRDGCLVIWKKNRPEDFKTAEDLVLGDRGGFIFEPEVGLHEGLYELDFSSLYPSIMVKYNISPECLDCPCCDANAMPVPGLRYHLCASRIGLIPRVLKPILERRRYYKKMKKEPGPQQETYRDRDAILKWLLVTCLDGSTVVPYKINDEYRVARIEQVIDRYLRNEGQVEPPDVLHVLGPDRDLRVVEKRVKKIIKARAPENILAIATQGGRRILATPNHRFFVLSNNGSLTEKRADELAVGDFLPEYASIPLENHPQESLNVLNPLFTALTTDERRCWRIKGNPVAQAVTENYPAILHRALDDGYTYRSAWLWKRGGPTPLRYLPQLPLTREELTELGVGRGQRHGGEIQYLPTEFRLDADLAFFLGFYIGDGSGAGRMVRLSIGMGEQELVGKLMNCARHKFDLVGQVRKERHANMLSLQFNSIALVRIMQTVFKIGRSAEYGKLVVPPLILNASEEVRYGFLSGLLASDGYISPNRDFASISSYKRDFVEAISLLMTTLGVRHTFSSMRPNGFPLYGIHFPCRDVVGKLWLKDAHRHRLETWTSSSTHRRSGVPVVESGLLDLCRRFKATHGLQQRTNRCVSTEKLMQKLATIEAKCHGEIPDVLKNLKRLASANLSFRRIRGVTSVPSKSKYVYCFETEDAPHGFVIAGGTLVGNSFGYTGYKNARYGRIECHEAINAIARDLLVRTMEIAESHSYDVVHGIVDSMWLRAREGADAIRPVIDHIAGSTGLPIELEGRYKWIVFLPCKTTGVGALNRYYGLFEHDEFKLRGIELRKHDTPEFINICQEAMLGELSLASNAAEFRERIPRAVDILRWTAKRVLDRAIPVHQFILTKNVSRTLPEYVVLTATAAALKQMEKRGFKVEPGESIRYVLLDARVRDSERKVRVAEFLQGDEEPDAWEYIRLLCRSGQTLLAPFGYTEEKLFAMCEDLSDVSIENVPERAIAIQEDYKSQGHSRARGGVGYRKPWRVVDDEVEPADLPAEI